MTELALGVSLFAIVFSTTVFLYVWRRR